MNLRRVKLDDFGITKEKYKELNDICRQYPAWVLELQSGNYSNETVLKSELIYNTAKETTDLFEYLISNVCYGETLSDIMDEKIPCSQRCYCDIKKKFFINLNKNVTKTFYTSNDTISIEKV